MIKKFLPIILLTFVNVIGFSLLIPVLPSIAERYAPEISQPIYGLLLSSYAFFQFLGAPVLGSLSDKYGRRPLLMVSQLGTTISWIIFAIAYFVPEISIGLVKLPLLIIAFSRIVDGITGGNVSVAQAWISDMTTQKEKTKAFGLMGAVFGMGFLIGPALGGLSGSTSIGYLGTCIVAFIISLITLMMIQFYLPESLTEDKRDKELDIDIFKEINILHKLQVFKENQFVNLIIPIRLAFMLVFGAYVTMIILFMRQAFSLSEIGLGLVLSLIGIFSIINQAIIVPRLSDKYGNLNIFYVSLVLFTLGLLLVPAIPLGLEIGRVNLSFGLFIINTFIVNAGITFGMPTFKAILVNNVDERRQGLATGIDESLIALGNSTTPVIAGVLYALIGSYTFWVFSFILILPFCWIFFKTGALLIRPDK